MKDFRHIWDELLKSRKGKYFYEKYLQILKTKSMKKIVITNIQLQEKNSAISAKGHMSMNFPATPALWKRSAFTTTIQQ